MPNLTFILPHWMYWSVLGAFPLVAMWIVRRQAGRRSRPSVNLPLAYLLWLCGGFVGIHRFYVKSLPGIVYIPLFVAILYGNVEGRAARDTLSGARNDLTDASYRVEYLAERRKDGFTVSDAQVAAARKAVPAAKEKLAAATQDYAFWQTFSGGFAAAIAVLLLIDAALLPRMVRRCAAREGPVEEKPVSADRYSVAAPWDGLGRPDALRTRLVRAIDRLSGWTGEFVAYWSLLAVFVYYYEVIARYVFNSPTNWAHESMFLMFGMQYLLSGAYALREDTHVRVDVIYLHLSRRNRLITDVITSFFFFVFNGALLVTGFIFMSDAIRVFELSFTEWAIQYWPVKITIPLGALLILLQGVSKLIKDLTLLFPPKLEG